MHIYCWNASILLNLDMADIICLVNSNFHASKIVSLDKSLKTFTISQMQHIFIAQKFQ